ncbi:DUF5131 family protein [Chloroflexota bacterium]
MQKTNIEWVKNPDGSQGYSWNPITGCLDRCGYCFARRLAHGRLRSKYLANDILAPRDEPNRRDHSANPFYPRFWPERLKELPGPKPWDDKGGRTGVSRRRDTTPKGIFVCNMCEFFGDWLPDKWQSEVFKVVRANYQHRFYFLTKQPWNVARFSPFPDNCWIGVTVCDKQMAFRAWWYYFKMVRAKVKFISFEPLLDDVMEPRGLFKVEDSDWVIIGSQTRPDLLPRKEWVDEIVEAADKAGVPVFLKDNLKPLMGDKLRQELPVS